MIWCVQRSFNCKRKRHTTSKLGRLAVEYYFYYYILAVKNSGKTFEKRLLPFGSGAQRVLIIFLKIALISYHPHPVGFVSVGTQYSDVNTQSCQRCQTLFSQHGPHPQSHYAVCFGLYSFGETQQGSTHHKKFIYFKSLARCELVV